MTLVTREDQNGIAILSLNRPDTLNALSPNLFVELREHVDAIANQTDTVGVVILRGEGRSFSAGNDLKAIEAGERAPSPHFQAETLDAIERLPQPVIAAVQRIGAQVARGWQECALCHSPRGGPVAGTYECPFGRGQGAL